MTAAAPRARARPRPRRRGDTGPAPPGRAPLRHRPRPGPGLDRGHRLPRGGRTHEGRGPRPPGGGPVYWVALAGDALSRCAVPLFFAIAGWVVLTGAPPRDDGADPQAADPHRRAHGRLDRRLPGVGLGTGRQHRPHAPARVGRRVRLRTARLPPLVPVRLRPGDPAAVRGRPGPCGQAALGRGRGLLGLALAPTLLGDLGRLLDVRVPPSPGSSAPTRSCTRSPAPYCCRCRARGRGPGAAPALAGRRAVRVGGRWPSTSTGCTSRVPTGRSWWRCWRGPC
ncbi:hypothetical protein LV779_21715 [Streptomyces thinghirensis]|nr:hypothetical protein [Streptomyces thinghirensis]